MHRGWILKLSVVTMDRSGGLNMLDGDDVFISYKSEDRERVRQIVSYLEALGVGVYWDRNLLPGQDYSQELTGRARAARAILVCWSAKANASHWVFHEAKIAMEENKLVFITFDRSEVPREFAPIHALHMPDQSTIPLSEQIEPLRTQLWSIIRRGAAPVARARSVARPDLALDLHSEEVRKAFALAENGDRGAALYDLGCAFAYGENGRPIDRSAAVKLFEVAGAEFGHVRAKWRLAGLFGVNGDLFDPFQSHHWMSEAAANHIPEAQHVVGLNYLEGKYVKRDIAAAQYWIELSASNNFAPAQYVAALISLEGSGERRPPEQVHDWLVRSAVAGFPDAALWLGDMIAIDPAVAVTLCQKAFYLIALRNAGDADSRQEAARRLEASFPR